MYNQKPSGTASESSILTLLHETISQLENRLALYPAKPVISDIRPSDFRLFMLIPEHPVTISQMARNIGVSRQAVHASIARLSRLKIVRLIPAPGSRRDKIAILTSDGAETRRLAAFRLEMMESAIEEKLDREKAAYLREILRELAFGDWPGTETSE